MQFLFDLMGLLKDFTAGEYAEPLKDLSGSDVWHSLQIFHIWRFFIAVIRMKLLFALIQFFGMIVVIFYLNIEHS